MRNPCLMFICRAAIILKIVLYKYRRVWYYMTVVRKD